ncbi:CoA pyrophosphatase [Sphingomonas parva]|uniref:CoA pyrophosphatase n=1 Tax=Sphingomonas parva TaxID=2555898 RepID=A0A4Y8ZPZ0_9SPHN|nr:CoA pyrophosphatase [Sphingomonas parva]TFI58071.1 CoA pyrophosphatase [Sphingomonas parva]
MSLADRLREALELGRTRSPELLAGDLLEDDGPASVPAAVLVAVVDRAVPTVILTERPHTMRKHPGQISFPGGRIEPEDRGPIEAALREAEEEIGLAPAVVDVIGEADPYRTITGFQVIPIVGVVPADLPLRPDPREVAGMFEAPLDFLLDPARQTVRTVDFQGQRRSYYEIMWDGRRIWGATAAMIVNLSRRLELVS